MGGKTKDLTGQKFGYLTVIECVGKDKWGKTAWRCLCQCGNERIADGSALTRGRIKSCGCLRELHGMTKDRLYREWYGMRKRCCNPNEAIFEYYGGRGIKVCDEWERSFIAFRDWAIANGYNDNLTIDRIDVNGNYCPENCRWATKKEQVNNRRNNRMLTYNDKTQTLAQWAEETDIPYSCLQKRIKYGWSVERILTTPVRERKLKNKKDVG